MSYTLLKYTYNAQHSYDHDAFIFLDELYTRFFNHFRTHFARLNMSVTCGHGNDSSEEEATLVSELLVTREEYAHFNEFFTNNNLRNAFEDKLQSLKEDNPLIDLCDYIPYKHHSDQLISKEDLLDFFKGEHFITHNVLYYIFTHYDDEVRQTIINIMGLDNLRLMFKDYDTSNYISYEQGQLSTGTFHFYDKLFSVPEISLIADSLINWIPEEGTHVSRLYTTQVGYITEYIQKIFKVTIASVHTNWYPQGTNYVGYHTYKNIQKMFIW